MPAWFCSTAARPVLRSRPRVTQSPPAGRILKDVEQFVLFNAVQAYVDVRRDEEFVRLALNDLDRLEETLRATENRFEVGEVTPD